MSEMKNAQNAFTNHTDEFISILLEAIQREKNKMKREQSRAAENRKNAQKCFFFSFAYNSTRAFANHIQNLCIIYFSLVWPTKQMLSTRFHHSLVIT